jgi:hypothetical protein
MRVVDAGPDCAVVASCCRTPEYDQASGVFGRALQTGVVPVVREGRVVVALSKKFSTWNEPFERLVSSMLAKL